MTQITLYPTDDNTFQTDSPNFNHGEATEIPAGEEDFTSTTYRLALKFSLSQIPPGSLINSASLLMYCFGDASNGTGRAKLYRVTADWAEGTITWNNQPAHDSSVITYSDITNGYVGDVTWTGLGDTVKNWFEGVNSNYGLKMRITETGTDNENDKHFKFYSVEYATEARRPRLVVNYTERGGMILGML